ncbi:hypothetical protein [Helicobacter pylori]|nr:hypothetical protein [Helicobacter pylori]
MISLFARYYGVIFENEDKLALIIVVLWGMRTCFGGGIEIFQNPIILKF